MASNDPYQPPENKTTITHAPFSRDEWRAMGWDFGFWAVIGSLAVGLVLTWRYNMSLSAIGMPERLGGLVAVSSLEDETPMVLIWAACNTLMTAMQKRRQTEGPLPNDIFHGPGLACLVVAYFPANIIFIGISFATAILNYDASPFAFRQSMDFVKLIRDIPRGFLALFVLFALLGTVGIHFVRWFSRFRLWVPLRAFILLVICWNFSTFTARILGIISLFWRD